MAKNLRQLKSKSSGRSPGSLKVSKAMLERSPMLTIGPKPQVRRNEKVEATWRAVLTDPPIDYSDSNKWRAAADVRPSSFPFCARKYGFKAGGLELPDDFSVRANFFTEIGKSVHYVSQNALARTGRLWGFWTCARPSCRKRFAEEPTFWPEDAVCKECQATYWEYDEMTLRDDSIGLKGHTDGILVFKNHSAVLEVKTSDDTKVSKMKSLSAEDLSLIFATESPWYGYWHQASTYASLARIAYPQLPHMKEVIYLIYSRNDPDNVISFTLDVPPDDSWWLEIRARIKMAQHAATLKVLPVGFAETASEVDNLPTCQWCAYKKLCLDPKGKLRYTGDALYDKSLREDLRQVLLKEKNMGTVITGDVVEPSDVLVPTEKPAPPPPKDNEEKPVKKD